MDHTCIYQPADTGTRCVRLAVFNVGSPDVAACSEHLAYFVDCAIADSALGSVLVSDHIHPVRDDRGDAAFDPGGVS